MPFFKSPFFLYRSQQWALWIVLLLLVFVSYYRHRIKEKVQLPHDLKALEESQKLWDSLHQTSFKQKAEIWPLSFNYLTDYQAYTLGISSEAFDLFQAYRKQGGWVNSLREFQEITHISDAKVAELRPYFKGTPTKKK